MLHQRVRMDLKTRVYNEVMRVRGLWGVELGQRGEVNTLSPGVTMKLNC